MKLDGAGSAGTPARKPAAAPKRGSVAETLAGQAQPGRAEVLDRLRAARALALEAEVLERQAWADARDEGHSWAQLAEAVGITRSGAQQRHRQLTKPSKRPAPSRSNQTHPGRP